MGLADARRHGSDADFRNQLDRDPRLGIDVLQVIDQLGKTGMEWRVRAMVSSTL
jgi:hypothetical protein